MKQYLISILVSFSILPSSAATGRYETKNDKAETTIYSLSDAAPILKEEKSNIHAGININHHKENSLFADTIFSLNTHPANTTETSFEKATFPASEINNLCNSSSIAVENDSPSIPEYTILHSSDDSDDISERFFATQSSETEVLYQIVSSPYVVFSSTTKGNYRVTASTSESISIANKSHEENPGIFMIQDSVLSTHTLTTQSTSNIGYKTACGNGNITSLGNETSITAFGICWNATGSPTLADNHTNEGTTTSTGDFTSEMKGLTGGRTYKARAYATSIKGTVYGNEVQFTTSVSSSVLVDYDFENNLYDASGNGNDAIESLSWTASYAPGQTNLGLNMNGGGWVILPDNIIQNNPSFSISLDFKTSSSGTLISYQNATSGDKMSFENTPLLKVYPSDSTSSVNSGLLAGELRTSSGSLKICSSARVDDNKWHNVVLSITPNSVSLYLDGEMLGERIGAIDKLVMKYNQIGTSRAKTNTDQISSYSGIIDNFVISTENLAKAQKTTATATPDSLKNTSLPGSQTEDINDKLTRTPHKTTGKKRLGKADLVDLPIDYLTVR